MNTSFQPAAPRADRAAAINAAKQASLPGAGNENETDFHDLLSDHNAHKTPARTDGTAADARQRVTTARRATEARAFTAPPAAPANQPLPPVQAVSVQQAMLTTPAPSAPGANDAATDAASGQPADGIANGTSSGPGSAPVAFNPNSGSPMPTGVAGAPGVDPRALPVSGNGGDPTLNGTIKPPPVASDDQPVDPAAVTGAPGKPTAINPDGPVVPAPPLQTPDQSATTRTADATSQVPAPSTNAPGVSPMDLATAPGDRMNPAVTPIPVSGLTGLASTTTTPAQESKHPDAPSANPPPAQAPQETAIPITTAAQAQLAASLTTDAPGNPVDAGAATFLTPTTANLAARVGQAPTKSVDRKSDRAPQVSDSDGLTSDVNPDGTAVADRLGNMMASPSILENATVRAVGSAPDASVFEALGFVDGRSSDSLRGRAKDGDAARASSVTALAPDSSPATAQTPFATAITAPSAGIVQMDKMETLLQTVQQTAAQAQFDGTGQVELRVRLQGVADDVTVRIHLDANRQTQVNFQTGSPELRAALEQGWSDLTASTGGDRQDSPSDSPDYSPAPSMATSSDSSRDSRPTLVSASSDTPARSTSRWSGYA